MMMNINEAKLKQAAQDQCNAEMAGQAKSAYDPLRGAKGYYQTPAGEAAEKALYHSEQSMKHSRAADFFQTNPAFQDFVELVRSGAIQLF